MTDHGRDILRLQEIGYRIARDRKERDALVRALVADGYGVREVARVANLSPAQVSRTARGESGGPRIAQRAPSSP